MGSLILTLLISLAGGAEMEHHLSWNLSIQGNVVGRRDLSVKYVKGDVGMRRIIESWTELDGAAGPIRVQYRQRMTAHAEGSDPAAFQSVIDEGGARREVQGRWTPSAWWVTVNADGRQRTLELPINRIDLSTADLMDPSSRLPLSHFEEARILSAESGEVLSGPITQLGIQDMDVAGESVLVTGYAWDSAQGRSEFYYSADGFLVRYTTQLLGIQMEANLAKPPPGGVDDFPVSYGPPAIEVTNL